MLHVLSPAAIDSQSKPSKGSSKQLQQIQRRFDEIFSSYEQSSLSSSVDVILRGKLAGRPDVTKVVSLGLGSFLERSKDQNRRLKQLAMFLSLAGHIKRASKGQTTPQLYAQDPAFTRMDEMVLQRYGVQVLKTSSIADLGGARQVIDENTLVYTPFLSLDAYKLLLGLRSVNMLIMDDFNALKLKWDKNTTEHRDVEGMMKSHVSQFRRRVVNGDGFWEDDDKPFPMALYWRQPQEFKLSSRL